MAELTKEYFEQYLAKQVGTLVSKTDLKDQLSLQTEELKTFAREQTEELARIVKAGFDGVDQQLDEIIDMIDVRNDVEELKQQMYEIRHAMKLDD